MSTPQATDSLDPEMVEVVPRAFLACLYEHFASELAAAIESADSASTYLKDRQDLDDAIGRIEDADALRRETLKAIAGDGRIRLELLAEHAWDAVTEATDAAFGHRDFIPEFRPTLRETAALMATVAEARGWLPTIGVLEPIAEAA